MSDNLLISKIQEIFKKQIPAFQKGVATSCGIGKDIFVNVNGKTIKAFSYNINSPGQVNVFYDNTNKRYIAWTEQTNKVLKNTNLILRKSKVRKVVEKLLYLFKVFTVDVDANLKVQGFGANKDITLNDSTNYGRLGLINTGDGYIAITKSNDNYLFEIYGEQFRITLTSGQFINGVIPFLKWFGGNQVRNQGWNIENAFNGITPIDTINSNEVFSTIISLQYLTPSNWGSNVYYNYLPLNFPPLFPREIFGYYDYTISIRTSNNTTRAHLFYLGGYGKFYKKYGYECGNFLEIRTVPYRNTTQFEEWINGTSPFTYTYESVLEDDNGHDNFTIEVNQQYQYNYSDGCNITFDATSVYRKDTDYTVTTESVVVKPNGIFKLTGSQSIKYDTTTTYTIHREHYNEGDFGFYTFNNLYYDLNDSYTYSVQAVGYEEITTNHPVFINDSTTLNANEHWRKEYNTNSSEIKTYYNVGNKSYLDYVDNPLFDQATDSTVECSEITSETNDKQTYSIYYASDFIQIVEERLESSSITTTFGYDFTFHMENPTLIVESIDGLMPIKITTINETGICLQKYNYLSQFLFFIGSQFYKLDNDYDGIFLYCYDFVNTDSNMVLSNVEGQVSIGVDYDLWHYDLKLTSLSRKIEEQETESSNTAQTKTETKEILSFTSTPVTLRNNVINKQVDVYLLIPDEKTIKYDGVITSVNTVNYDSNYNDFHYDYIEYTSFDVAVSEPIEIDFFTWENFYPYDPVVIITEKDDYTISLLQYFDKNGITNINSYIDGKTGKVRIVVSKNPTTTDDMDYADIYEFDETNSKFIRIGNDKSKLSQIDNDSEFISYHPNTR